MKLFKLVLTFNILNTVYIEKLKLDLKYNFNILINLIGCIFNRMQ
jgi:hypothetical protein